MEWQLLQEHPHPSCLVCVSRSRLLPQSLRVHSTSSLDSVTHESSVQPLQLHASNGLITVAPCGISYRVALCPAARSTGG